MTDITILPFSFPAVARKIVTADFDGGRYNIAHGRRHKKLTDWARQAILQVRRWLPEHMIVVVADSSFAALDLIAAVRRHVCLVTRLRLDASLFEPPPKRHASQKGRPPKKGRRLPKLSQRLEDKKTHWTRLSMPYWYGDERCILEIATGTAVWYHSGLPPAPIRWVLVRDPTDVRDPQAFLCTDLDATPVSYGGIWVTMSGRRRNGVGVQPTRTSKRSATPCSRIRSFPSVRKTKSTTRSLKSCARARSG